MRVGGEEVLPSFGRTPIDIVAKGYTYLARALNEIYDSRMVGHRYNVLDTKGFIVHITLTICT
jgi:hypothetical protein